MHRNDQTSPRAVFLQLLQPMCPRVYAPQQRSHKEEPVHPNQKVAPLIAAEKATCSATKTRCNQKFGVLHLLKKKAVYSLEHLLIFLIYLLCLLKYAKSARGPEHRYGTDIYLLVSTPPKYCQDKRIFQKSKFIYRCMLCTRDLNMC